MKTYRLLAAALVAACSSRAGMSLDAHVVPTSEASCEAGATCATGTCTDFGVFGGKLCATSCASDSDCTDGFACIADVTDHRVCAPPQFAGPVGAYPELVCLDMRVCDVGFRANEDGCTSSLNTCLAGLTPAQRAEWQRAVEKCLDAQTTCSGVFGSGAAGCYAQVPWC